MTRPVLGAAVSRILLLHGWRVRDGGRGSIGALAPHLEALGHEVLTLSYGYTLTPNRTRFRSRKYGKLWSARTRPGDVVIGHSNGCRVAWELSWYTVNVQTMIWIQASLDPDVIPGPWVKRCLVVHNRRDWAVWLGARIPWSIWGEMGRVGYRPREEGPFGADPRMINLERGRGHSDWMGTEELAAVCSQFIGTAQS